MANEKEHDIKVVMGTNIRRESVLIDPKLNASDNPRTGEQARNVIATGNSAREVAAKIYGRR